MDYAPTLLKVHTPIHTEEVQRSPAVFELNDSRLTKQGADRRSEEVRRSPAVFEVYSSRLAKQGADRRRAQGPHSRLELR